jgi:hypothetical protein
MCVAVGSAVLVGGGVWVGSAVLVGCLVCVGTTVLVGVGPLTGAHLTVIVLRSFAITNVSLVGQLIVCWLPGSIVKACTET